MPPAAHNERMNLKVPGHPQALWFALLLRLPHNELSSRAYSVMCVIYTREVFIMFFFLCANRLNVYHTEVLPEFNRTIRWCNGHFEPQRIFNGLWIPCCTDKHGTPTTPYTERHHYRWKSASSLNNNYQNRRQTTKNSASQMSRHVPAAVHTPTHIDVRSHQIYTLSAITCAHPFPPGGVGGGRTIRWRRFVSFCPLPPVPRVRCMSLCPHSDRIINCCRVPRDACRCPCCCRIDRNGPEINWSSYL